MNLNEFLKNGESDIIEFKKSVGEWREIVETVSAFSNTKGGTIFVGIDKGEIIDVTIGKGTVEDLTNKILSNTEPKIYPEITIKKLNRKNIISIKVETYPYDAVLAFGKPFKRIGKNTVRMANDEYKKRILEIHKKELYFDGQICSEVNFSAIDLEKVRIFVKKAEEARKLDIGTPLSEKETLRRLKLMKGDNLINAAVLLFAKRPQDVFIQSAIKCVRFKGIDVTNDMLDFKEIGGDLFSQIEEAEKFVFSNITLKAWIEDRKMERTERWEYPPKAIREALVNAIVHRDYRSPSKVQIRIFDDRIEFWNPGKLPEGWTVETFKKEHTSEPFNPLIARMFFWVGLVEEVGTGTNKIVNWCKEWGLPEADFEYIGNSIVLRFRKDIYTEEYLRNIGLNERQIKGVSYVKEKGKITNREYQKLNTCSRNTATNELRELVQKGITKESGKKGAGAFYVIA